MFSAIRRRVRVNPATVIASLALVFAMTGGAYAAKKYLITSTKQISPSVLKSLQGKAGPVGAAGAAGAQGPAGPAGSAGAQGSPGPKGDTGAPGAKGATGATGQTGFTKVLPKGETETGEWAMMGDAPNADAHFATAVSFDIPLENAPAVHYIRTTGKEPFYNETSRKEEEREQPACPGSAAEPEATSGSLCVYASIEENDLKLGTGRGSFVLPTICSFASDAEFGGGFSCVADEPAGKSDKHGFGVIALSESEGLLQTTGTWAVTAE